MKYQQPKNISPTNVSPISNVLRIGDDGVIWLIPFSPDNADFQTFKREVVEGVELQDADGNIMAQDQVNEFIKTLP